MRVGWSRNAGASSAAWASSSSWSRRPTASERKRCARRCGARSAHSVSCASGGLRANRASKARRAELLPRLTHARIELLLGAAHARAEFLLGAAQASPCAVDGGVAPPLPAGVEPRAEDRPAEGQDEGGAEANRAWPGQAPRSLRLRPGRRRVGPGVDPPPSLQRPRPESARPPTRS